MVLRNALRTSLLVGTLLTLTNQGSALVADGVSVTVLVKILVNFLVPFAVAVHSRRGLLRELSRAALVRDPVLDGIPRREGAG